MCESCEAAARLPRLDERVRICEKGRRTDRGRRGCGVNGTVSLVQVSLLRVLCPKTLLSPYLLPLSSTADSVCLDCRSEPPSLLSLLPHLCHSCDSSVHRDCSLPCATTCIKWLSCTDVYHNVKLLHLQSCNGAALLTALAANNNGFMTHVLENSRSRVRRRTIIG